MKWIILCVDHWVTIMMQTPGFCIKCKTHVFIDKKNSVELEQRLKMGYGETECLRSGLESILKPMLRSLNVIEEGNDIVRFYFVLFTWMAI